MSDSALLASYDELEALEQGLPEDWVSIDPASFFVLCFKSDEGHRVRAVREEEVELLIVERSGERLEFVLGPGAFDEMASGAQDPAEWLAMSDPEIALPPLKAVERYSETRSAKGPVVFRRIDVEGGESFAVVEHREGGALAALLKRASISAKGHAETRPPWS